MDKKLTPEQEALLPVQRDKWLAIGLATGACDRALIDAAVDKLYQRADLTPPKQRIWVNTPREGAFAAHILSIDGDLATLPTLMKTKDKVLIAKVRNQVSNACFGQHDAGWLSFYDFFEIFAEEHPELGIEKVRGLVAMAQCGWYWPFTEAIVLCERPTSLHRDDQHRLHSTVGPALRYAGDITKPNERHENDFNLYYVHGVRVPAHIIEKKEDITADMIQNEANAEVRRVMTEFYGIDRYLIDSGAQVIHKDAFGELLRQEVSGDEPIVAVKVLNSTPEPDGSVRTYTIRVPPTMKTTQEALAWTFGLKEKQYKPRLET